MRLILVTVAWVLGISLARQLPALGAIHWLALSIITCAAALVFRNHQYRWHGLALIALSLGGLRQASLPQTSDLAQYNGSHGTVTGIVIDEPLLRDERVQLRLAAHEIFVNANTVETSGLVLIESYTAEPPAYGDRVRATGRLTTPATWDTFSYADYLGRQGVFSIMQNAAIEVVGSGYGSPIHAALLRFKHTAHRQIQRALPDPQAALLAGIVLGNEAGIAPDLEEDFRRVGASHIVAISGFNMVVISAIVMRVAGGLLGERRNSAAVLAIAFIFAYSILVGATAGILRAALMSSLLVIGETLKRKTFVPTSLAFAALLLSILDPNVLLDVGFQLSFCAVLGLGLFADPLSSRFRALLESLFPHRIANWMGSALNEPLVVSLAAQISTLPLVLLYFGRLSLVALPVNMLIVPVQSAILLLALLAIVVSFIAPVVGTALYWAALVFLSWSIAIVRAFAQLEYADIALHIDGRLIQLFYLLMIGGTMVAAARPPFWNRLIHLVNQRRLFTALAAAAAVALVLLTAMFLSRPDGRLHVWVLDMGHSNAILLETPGGAQMLIDGGRFPSRLLTAIGDRLPFYDREIEILAITHPDEWDIAALSAVLNRYTVGVALMNGQPNRTEVYQEIQRRLAEAGITQLSVRAGYTIDTGDGVTVEVLHPQATPRITDALGDQVMVLRVSFGEISFLLPSDLSRSGQQRMMDSGVWPLADVLQLPDHGSARSLDSQFLDAVQPQIALLQSDIANHRDDPHPDTLLGFTDLIEAGRFFRTDEIGTIHLRTDGSIVEVVGERNSLNSYSSSRRPEGGACRAPNSGASIVLDIDSSAALGRFQNRIADDGIAVTIDEGGAIGRDLIVIDDRLEEVMEFVNEAMFPADDMPLRPPVFPIGMVRLRHQNIVESLRRIRALALPKHIQFVETFEIELD